MLKLGKKLGNFIKKSLFIHAMPRTVVFNRCSTAPWSSASTVRCFRQTGVAPGIFRRGLTLPTRGLKYGFQGTINAKNLRKNRLSPSDGVASMLRRGAIALPWSHSCRQNYANAMIGSYFLLSCADMRTGIPRAIGMFLWGSVPAKRLTTTNLE